MKLSMNEERTQTFSLRRGQEGSSLKGSTDLTSLFHLSGQEKKILPHQDTLLGLQSHGLA